ncbi:hypothetical protein [uncultured Devosia sp.]|uniref:hypothetical protein n=1 Tax=uncultured Devosia sp. TaxID=211434 RepID=UPI0035C94FFC
MMQLRNCLLALPILFGTALAATAAPANFVYTSAGELPAAQTILERPDIEGAQVVYNWKLLEPSQGAYDFSAIERDLALTDALGKKLFVQVQDRFFSPEARNIPAYLLEDARYGGGLVQQIEEGKTEGYGWTTMQWLPAVRKRYQALLSALAARFDGKIYGVNLPETAIDVTEDRAEAGFACDSYFDAELENLKAARAAFTQSVVVQYVNFWPCEWDNDHHYMSRLFDFAQANDIGLGGPDIVPWREGQMNNSYPFFNASKGALRIVGMAVQEPTLDYVNEATGKPFTKAEFVEFATDYLGVDAVFWSTQTPWLQE